MDIKQRWKNLSRTEKLLIVCAILLVIMIATRLSYTVDRVHDGFNYFLKDSTTATKQ